MEEWRQLVMRELRACSDSLNLVHLRSVTDALTSARPGAKLNVIYDDSARIVQDFLGEVERLGEQMDWDAGGLQKVQDAGLALYQKLEALDRRLWLSCEDVEETDQGLLKTLVLEKKRMGEMLRGTRASYVKLLDIVKEQPPYISPSVEDVVLEMSKEQPSQVSKVGPGVPEQEEVMQQMKVDLLALKYFHCTRCFKGGRPYEYFAVDIKPPKCQHGKGMYRKKVFVVVKAGARGPWKLTKIPWTSCESINLAEAYVKKNKDFVMDAYKS
ncbi:hypothetical protein KFL_002980030 [Klebsormidium nitens]|uniref:Uncharacterized protein n=1 Tax=Klebsormidium nitens TaxID=105231 RepID=A0A1Y1IAX4_KLENI|nr:hypothetical protein KFL_002980030 [Klebsormidium nitens]|eukprot:GAQ86579.1 hypothetical protein KFL_002980030 [Klebsormidium nitens]